VAGSIKVADVNNDNDSDDNDDDDGDNENEGDNDKLGLVGRLISTYCSSPLEIQFNPLKILGCAFDVG
jgi:hypothetical protein